MAKAMRPVTDWLATMFWILTNDRKLDPVVGLRAKTTIRSTRKIASPDFSKYPPNRGDLRAVEVEADRSAVSVIVFLALHVDQLVELVGRELFGRYVRDESSVAENDRAVDELRHFFHV